MVERIRNDGAARIRSGYHDGPAEHHGVHVDRDAANARSDWRRPVALRGGPEVWHPRRIDLPGRSAVGHLLLVEQAAQRKSDATPTHPVASGRGFYRPAPRAARRDGA